MWRCVPWFMHLASLSKFPFMFSECDNSWYFLLVSAADASLFPRGGAGANSVTGSSNSSAGSSRVRGASVTTLGGASAARSGDCGLSCEHCGKVCPRPSILKRHMMMHTGERPFECKVSIYLYLCSRSVPYGINKPSTIQSFESCALFSYSITA